MESLGLMEYPYQLSYDHQNINYLFLLMDILYFILTKMDISYIHVRMVLRFTIIIINHVIKYLIYLSMEIREYSSNILS